MKHTAPKIMHERHVAHPKSKAGQLADLLRVRLSADEWDESLPSERALAEQYLVSRTTLRKALEILHGEGWLGECASTRSGRTVKKSQRKTHSKKRSDKVVLLTPSLNEGPILLEHLAILREMLGRRGMQVEIREIAHLLERKKPQEMLAQLVAKTPGAVWVLYKMPQPLQLAAQHLGLPCVIYGSAFPNVELPSIDVDFGAVARHATGRCLVNGLTRLAVLIHRTGLAGDSIIVNEITAELAKAGAPALLVLRHDFNRARLLDALDLRIVPLSARPDALLVVNQHHLLTALPHLLHRGLRIPDDLSLIYLSNDPVVERLSPLPDRYDLGTLLPRRLATAIQALANGERPVSSRLLPNMIVGESFATHPHKSPATGLKKGQ